MALVVALHSVVEIPGFMAVIADERMSLALERASAISEHEGGEAGDAKVSPEWETEVVGCMMGDLAVELK